MGLLDLLMPYSQTSGFGPQKTSNPFTQWYDQNRGKVVGGFAGLAGAGNDPRSALQGFTQGLVGGTQRDDAYAEVQKADAEKAAALKKSQDEEAARKAWIQANAPQYAGLPASDAIAMAKGGGDGADPSDVATYKFYANQELTAGRKPLPYMEFKQQASAGGGQMLSPVSLDLIAGQYLAGDKSAISGFARNAGMRAQIANAVADRANAMGMDGKAIAAEISAYGGNVAAQRVAGTRAATVGIAASEANQMADLALEASKNVPRSQFVPWNQAVQMYQRGTSDPNLARMVAATTSLVNAYARAVSPVGQPTDAQRAHAEEMLNNAQSPEAYAAVIDQMQKEMVAALNAPDEISANLKTSITGGGALPPPGGNTTSTGVTWSVGP